jgi:hypothetical protein
MSQLTKEMFLVGSIPLDTVDDVFAQWGTTLGEHLPCMPDGEVGDRIWWHNYLAYRFYDGHPALETVQRPAPIDGVPQWKPKDLHDMWLFKVRPGVATLQFEELGYGREAIASFEKFAKLREAGEIPADVRFQVCLPLTGSGLDTFFHDPADNQILRPAYEDAILREIQRMVEHIPGRDLAIQWDVCVEVLDLENRLPWTVMEGKWERNTSPISRLSPHIPEDVALIYHWCYGTLGEWPMTRPEDLSLCVRLSNEAVKRSGRRVDAVHMPVPRHPEDSYFAPLADLDIGDTTVYLGMIHDSDGLEGFRRRYQQAKHYLPSFGVSSVCGYGRYTAEDMPPVLEIHREVAEELSRST